MKRKISLDTNEINSLIEELNDYADSLKDKCQLFVQALGEAGIKVAKSNLGEYGDYILVFMQGVRQTDTGCKALVVAMDGKRPVRTWKYAGGTKSVEISPILMAEFGSGWAADDEPQIPGMGQGSFPGQTHAFDTNGWYWQTEDGEYHHSYGEAPTYPMYKASVEMLTKIQEIAEQYF